jgi:hypothetical protein
VSIVRHQRHRGILLACVAMLASLFLAPAAAQAYRTPPKLPILPFAKILPFYVPPSPLPDVPNGTLLRAQRLNFQRSTSQPPVGTIGWRILYMSRNALNQPIAVSGTVLEKVGNLPKNMPTPDKRPVVAYGNEAQGIGDQCAVSRLLQYGNSGEVALWSPLLNDGDIVVSSDFEGMGTPGLHTFGVNVSEGHTILDSIRAAKQLDGDGVSDTNPLGMIGYSQGGGGVGYAAQIAPTYAPELKFVAVAVGGMAIDPMAMAKDNDDKIFSSLDVISAAGYDAAYPDLKLKSYLNAFGLNADRFAQGSCEEIGVLLGFRHLSDFETSNPLDSPAWQQRFAENTLGASPPREPVYMFHAIADEASPFWTARKLRAQWCHEGATVWFTALPWPVEHVSGAPVWMPYADRWLDNMFGGAKPTNNCAGADQAPAGTPGPSAFAGT